MFNLVQLIPPNQHPTETMVDVRQQSQRTAKACARCWTGQCYTSVSVGLLNHRFFRYSWSHFRTSMLPLNDERRNQISGVWFLKWHVYFQHPFILRQIKGCSLEPRPKKLGPPIGSPSMKENLPAAAAGMTGGFHEFSWYSPYRIITGGMLTSLRLALRRYRSLCVFRCFSCGV